MSLVGVVQRDINKSKNKENRMVEIPFSLTACAVVTTMMFALTYRILTEYGGYTIRIWRNGTPNHSTTGFWNLVASSMKIRNTHFVRSYNP
jgi:hypothetical protein